MTVARLRAHAILRSLFVPTTLKSAVHRLGFVQADPIRSPARAQDLILRHRVKGYRVGDLEQRYSTLDIEEDFFYAYGFLPRANWGLLHPRVMGELSEFEQSVLNFVLAKDGRVHPRQLEAELGRERAPNYWGGYSKTTTKALHLLHFRGLLRIAGREKGIRIYEAAPASAEHLAPEVRLRRMVLLICGILAPVPLRSLWDTLRLLRYGLRGLEVPPSIIQELLRSGEMRSAEVDGLTYLWPTRKLVVQEPPPVVRLLAPFDPVVWDRRRFQHLWGWPYRFEAYTPPRLRARGYYAMPMLWGDRMVGWANARLVDGNLDTQIGFAEKRITDRAFRSALDEEVESMRLFLRPK